ncbi:ferredoxin family protein [Myxococcota bacterium]
MALVSIDAAACTACATCIDVCPMDVLRFDPQSGVASVRYLEDCIWCFRCELECPVACIRVVPGIASERPSAL